MADASNVRHDTIVVPERMSPAQVRALAERKAQAQVGDDDMVAFLHLHGSRPVGGEHGTGVSRYRLLPTAEQAGALAEHCRHARYVGHGRSAVSMAPRSSGVTATR